MHFTWGISLAKLYHRIKALMCEYALGKSGSAKKNSIVRWSHGSNWTSHGDHILTSVTKNRLKTHIFNAFYAYNMSKWPQENALSLKFSLMGCCSMKYCTIIGFLPDFRNCTLKIWSFFVIAQANSAQIFALVGNFRLDSKSKCISNWSTGTNRSIKNKNWIYFDVSARKIWLLCINMFF